MTKGKSDSTTVGEVFARADRQNINSGRVLEKVGLKFIETFDLEGTEHNWYKIDEQEFH